MLQLLSILVLYLSRKYILLSRNWRLVSSLDTCHQEHMLGNDLSRSLGYFYKISKCLATSGGMAPIQVFVWDEVVLKVFIAVCSILLFESAQVSYYQALKVFNNVRYQSLKAKLPWNARHLTLFRNGKTLGCILGVAPFQIFIWGIEIFNLLICSISCFELNAMFQRDQDEMGELVWVIIVICMHGTSGWKSFRYEWSLAIVFKSINITNMHLQKSSFIVK